MRNISFILSALFVILSLTSYGQLKGKSKRQMNKQLKMQEVEQLVESKHFTFIPRSLTTSSGFHKDLTSTYELQLMNDSTVAYLPFWGTSHMPSMNDEGGIKFETKAQNLKLENKKKKGYVLSFDAKGEEDSYQINMDISQEGYTTVSITSNRKSYISYYGKIEKIKKEE